MGSLGVQPIRSVQADIITRKYEEERQKRMRPDGLSQYVDLREVDQQSNNHLAEDPFSAEYGDRPWAIPPGLDSGRSKIVIIGTGYAGLTYAVRLMEGANFAPEDIVFLDASSGFGGAWYWNRYPGVMCDVESACYMPLLEETGYVPKNRYAYGSELREYAELIASRYCLTHRALWKTTVKSATWNESKKEWSIQLLKQSKDGQIELLTICTTFLVLTAGPLTNPKLPKIPGASTFTGQTFHTARWDYKLTGGTQENPTLSKLQSQRVAFIGTGATCIQAAPHLAKWAKELTIFQRTPSAVDTRGQQDVDPEQFRRHISNKKGWQRARRENMGMFVEGSTPNTNLVQDAWTTFPSYSALIGGPATARLTEETLPNYLAELHTLDLPRQERIRKRVTDIVKNPAAADALTPWYPGWCKRPCFHDDYLDTFNRANTTLVDTRGRGVEAITETGLVFDGNEYPADILIYGTGFEPVTAGGPSLRASMQIFGRGGVEMETKWSKGLATLHGLITHDFPNLFLSGVYQMGTTVNFAHMADVMATHVASMIAQARQQLAATQTRPSGAGDVVIEPSVSAEESWAQRVLATGPAFAGLAGCTPSYSTAEGKRARSKEEALAAARVGNWGKGFLDYAAVVEEWDRTGDLDGLEICASSA